jgi:predicted XRE-type DNA-binding protein
MTEETVQLGSGNLFADLGFADPVAHKLKAELVSKIASIMAERGLTQSKAAGIVGVSQPDLSRLLKGRFRDVSVERLLRMLTRLECDVDIRIAHHGREVGNVIHIAAA